MNNILTSNGFAKAAQQFDNRHKALMTEVEFISNMAKGYGVSIQSDKNKGVGMITNSSSLYSAIALLPDATFVDLAYRALENILGSKEGFGEGLEKYEGIHVEDIMADNVAMDLVMVSSKIEAVMINAIVAADLNDISNLRKIFVDINDFFRMYQELTIDAAKKLYTIDATFYTDILRPDSSVKLAHNFPSVKFEKVEEFEIRRVKPDVTPKESALGEMVEFQNNSGKTTRVSFKDNISIAQDAISESLTNFVQNQGKVLYSEVKISDEVKATFGLTGNEGVGDIVNDMYEYIRKPFAKLIVWKVTEEKKVRDSALAKEISEFAESKAIEDINYRYDQEINKLSNYARFITQSFSMADAGKLLYITSNVVRAANKLVIDDNSTNRMYLSIAPELFKAYALRDYADIKVCGYPLMGNTKDLVEGQVITFDKGCAVGLKNVFINANYDGELTVETIKGSLSAVKPIVINPVPFVAPEDVTIAIYEGGVIDAAEFITKGSVKKSDFATMKAQGVLEKAKSIKIVPRFTYKEGNKEKHILNAVIAYVPMKNDPTTILELPIAQYIGYSSLFESQIAGLVSNEIVKFVFDGKTLRLKLKYGQFDKTVSLNKSKVAPADGTVVIVDPFESVMETGKDYIKDTKILDDPFAPEQDTISDDVIGDSSNGSIVDFNNAIEGNDFNEEMFNSHNFDIFNEIS